MADDETLELEESSKYSTAIENTELSKRYFSPENIDILNDVDIDIMVVIGQAKMKISELLNLKKGGVIELLQGSDEPLQIYANDKMIAKGVIISSNGKYCVKII